MDKGHTIQVLDHGYVRLVDWMGSDERICEAARISYKAPSKGPESDRKLIHYLYKNRHTSPFEMNKLTLDIKMPIFVARQYSRHRMQSMNEVSARYTELPEEFYIPPGWRFQDTKNKQSSRAEGKDHQGSTIDDKWNPTVEVYNHIPTQEENYSRIPVTATAALKAHCHDSYELYKNMIAQGIAREMARMVLPVNIYTEIYCLGSEEPIAFH